MARERASRATARDAARRVRAARPVSRRDVLAAGIGLGIGCFAGSGDRVLARRTGARSWVDAQAVLGPELDVRLLEALRQVGVGTVVVPVDDSRLPEAAALADLRSSVRMVEERIRRARGLAAVRTSQDLERAARADVLAVVYAAENAGAIGDAVSGLDELYALGIRVLQLTHDGRNLLGDGGDVDANAGLTRLGIDVIARMNELGMLIDLAHAGEATARAAFTFSRTPVAVTHTACRALFDHPRNMSDEILRGVAERGGVVGLHMAPALLGPPGSDVLEGLLSHVEHAVRVSGVDHVGVGSARLYERGRAAVADALAGSDRLRRLADALAGRGHDAPAIDKILGSNFRRLLADTLRAA